MNLQTHIPLKPSGFNLEYDDKVLLVGSCFVENMGKKLAYSKFQTLINPLGILFNPIGLAHFFDLVAGTKKLDDQDFVFNNEQWHYLHAHSSLSSTSKSTLYSKLERLILQTKTWLASTDLVVITLGTAWGYVYKDTGITVANCHKIPQKKFDKVLSSPAKIFNALNQIVDSISQITKEARICFTVSPVRHIKDGFVENQRSKSHLLTALHEVLDHNAELIYFPSYELMMDELRDYRFYERDMIHPNLLAVDYIWERFVAVFLSPQAQQIKQDIEEVQKGLSHRPFNPNSTAHQNFVDKLDLKIKKLTSRFPHISF